MFTLGIVHKNVFYKNIFRYVLYFTGLTSIPVSPSLQNYPTIKSRTNLQLSVNNIGLFIIRNLGIYNSGLKSKYSYLFKLRKLYYSFMKHNQIKNTILRRKSTIVLYQLLLKVTNQSTLTLSSKNNVFFNKSLLDPILRTALNNTILKNRNLCEKFYSYKFKNTTNITRTNTFNNEVKLSRVKFKPGYQRLWRESRLALKDLLGLKFLYQQQLTKYVSRFVRKSQTDYSLSNELTLEKLLVYSRLVPDYNTLNIFYNSNLIFINSKLPKKININCVLNDLVQIIVSK
jgi:hypothetical protein